MSDSRAEQLDNYIGGWLEESTVETFEEELFAAALAPPVEEHSLYRAAHFTSSISLAMKEMAGRGTLKLGISLAEFEALKQSDLHVTSVEFENSKREQSVLISEQTEITVGCYPLALARSAGISNVDVEVSFEGKVAKIIKDLPIDQETGTLFLTCEGEVSLTVARLAVTMITGVRIFDVKDRRHQTPLFECYCHTTMTDDPQP